MSNTDKTAPAQRTEAEIQAELEAARQDMAATVDELFGRVQPDYIIDQAKQSAKNKAAEIKSLAMDTAASAKEGDPEALKKVGYVVAGVAVLTALIVLKIARGRR